MSTQQSGNSSGPIMRAGPPPQPPCRIVDPILAALQLDVNLGLEIKAPKVSVGASLYKNLMTGETGGQAQANVGIVGASVYRPTPRGSITGSAPPPQVAVNVSGFEHNFSTGENTWWKDISLGLTLGVGFTVHFDKGAFDQQVLANAACTARGGK